MAKITETQLNALLRGEHFTKIVEFLQKEGEDVQIIKASELAYPVVDAKGSEKWIKVAVIVPRGSKEDGAFDGYELAEH